MCIRNFFILMRDAIPVDVRHADKEVSRPGTGLTNNLTRMFRFEVRVLGMCLARGSAEAQVPLTWIPGSDERPCEVGSGNDFRKIDMMGRENRSQLRQLTRNQPVLESSATAPQ